MTATLTTAAHSTSACDVPDTYRWVELWGYDALVDVARRHQLGEAQVWADHLMTEASALGMRPFAQRARSSELPATPPAHVSVHSD